MALLPLYTQPVSVNIEPTYDPALTLTERVHIEMAVEELLLFCFPNRDRWTNRFILEWEHAGFDDEHMTEAEYDAAYERMKAAHERTCHCRLSSPFLADATLAAIDSNLKHYFKDKKVTFAVTLGTYGS